jgi:hypothetical protein
MTVPAVTGVVTTGAIARTHPGFNAVPVAITQGMHLMLRWVSSKVAIGTEIQIDVTPPATLFIGPCGFCMKPGVVTLVVRGPNGLAIGVADLASHGSAARLHVTGMTDCLQRFVIDNLYRFELFKVSDFVGRERMAGHTSIGALGHNIHVCLMWEIDIRSFMALLPPFRLLLFAWIIGSEHPTTHYQ